MKLVHNLCSFGCSPRYLLFICSTLLVAALIPITAGGSTHRSPLENRPMQEFEEEIATTTFKGNLSERDLWRIWHAERFIETPAACLKHDSLTSAIEQLTTAYPEVESRVIGRSFEGRAIRRLEIGSGERRILLWSQMHGDEPSATPALLDLIEFLMKHRSQEQVRRILETFELHLVPMLNPDGAERFERRNAQGIDINRDALNLATPEGRLLKKLRAELEPFLAFNLHDQNRRTMLPDTGKLSTMSVLAVSGDEAGTLTEGRRRAMRACSAIVAKTDFHLEGRIGRYDEDWSPRAFGDNITAWGTPVVLIESGGVPPGHPLSDLTALNFVSLFSVLDQLAADDLASYDETTYRELPRTGQGFSDVVLRGGRVLQPGSTTPYRADIAFNRIVPERTPDTCAISTATYSDATRGMRPTSAFVTEVGDARYEVGGRELESPRSIFLRPLTVAIGSEELNSFVGDVDSSTQARNLLPLGERLVALGVGTVHLPEEASGLAETTTALAHSKNLALPRLSIDHDRPSQVSRLDHDVLLAVSELDSSTIPRTIAQVIALLAGTTQTTDLSDWIETGERERIQPGSRADLLEVVSKPSASSDTDLLQFVVTSLFLGGQHLDTSALVDGLDRANP